MDEQKKALEQIKVVYDDGFAEINGRRYHFLPTNHSRRTEVFAYFTSIQALSSSGNFSFLVTPEFKKIWGVLEDKFIMFNGMQLSKLTTHWDEYPDDYITLVMTAFGVMSYPFIKGASTS